MTDLTPAGYIVTDDSTTIHGSGATADLAWADVEYWLSCADIALLDDDEDSGELGSWARRSDFKARPATQALLDAVARRGGCIGWTCVGRVACTYDESYSSE